MQSTYPSSMCHCCHCHCHVVALWLLSSWFCHSHHIVAVSSSLSCIVAVSSPSLHCCVVFVVFVVVVSWVSSLLCHGCHRCHVVAVIVVIVVVVVVVVVVISCCGCGHHHVVTAVIVASLLWSSSHCHCGHCHCVVVIVALSQCHFHCIAIVLPSSLSHRGVVVLLWCCHVVAVLTCLCLALDIIHVIPGLLWASPLPTLFILAIHLVDGLGPRTCPCHYVIIVALLLCHVIVTLSLHHVTLSLCHCHHHIVIAVVAR